MENCKSYVEDLITNIESSIEACENEKNTIKKLPFFVGVVQLEEISRDVQELYLRAEELVPRTVHITKECHHYHNLSKKYCDKLPIAERPNQITCTLYNKEEKTQ